MVISVPSGIPVTVIVALSSEVGFPPERSILPKVEVTTNVSPAAALK
jgi:hypothetical protein